MGATLETAQKPTYEQLEFRVQQQATDLEKAYASIREKAEDAKRLRLILRGMVDEQFHLHVTLDPEIFDKNAFEAVQALLKNYVGRTVGEIDEKLGGPLRLLQEALMHINYLENHAHRNGVAFTQFERRARDAWLYY